jgi:hypothetical protein
MRPSVCASPRRRFACSSRRPTSALGY